MTAHVCCRARCPRAKVTVDPLALLSFKSTKLATKPPPPRTGCHWRCADYSAHRTACHPLSTPDDSNIPSQAAAVDAHTLIAIIRQHHELLPHHVIPTFPKATCGSSLRIREAT